MPESNDVSRLIIPVDETVLLLSGANKIYLRQCPCRKEKGSCRTLKQDDWMVCILFEHDSQEEIAKATEISTDEAIRIYKEGTKRGDIHQLFYYTEGSRPYELCTCCDCCCGALRDAKIEGNYPKQLHGQYVAVTDADQCTACGACLDSCFFEARQLNGDTLELIDGNCFGCGRCIADCPNEAISLAFVPERGVPVPGV